MITNIEIQIAKELGVPVQNVCTVGSTLICGKGNDTDLLCLVPSDDCLTKAGFSPDVDLQYESALHSWRRGDINIIAVNDRAFFLAEVAITYGAMAVRMVRYNMDDRADRVAFHTLIRGEVLRRIDASTALPVQDFDDI
jgi:hypothetical protein